MKSAPIPRITAFSIVILAIIAIGIRLDAARDALWIDEWITAWTVSDGWSEIAPRTALGHSGPLFYQWQWLIGSALGSGPLQMRTTSLVAGCVLLALVGWTVYRQTGKRLPAVAVVALAAVDPLWVFYATEARPYALVQLLGAVHVLLFVRLVISDSRDTTAVFLARTASWLAVGVLLFWLHYTASMVVAAELVCAVGWAIAFPRHRRRVAGLLAISLLAAGLVVVTSDSLTATWRGRAAWSSFVDVRSFLESLTFAAVAFGIPAAVAMFGGMILPAAPSPQSSVQRAERTGERWWLAGAVVLTTWLGALLATSSLGIPVAHYRYVIAASGLVPMIAGIAIGNSPKLLAELVSGLCLLAAALYFVLASSDLPSGQLQRPLRYERWDSACQRILSATDSSDWPVCVFPNLIEDDQIAANMSERERGFFLAPVMTLQKQQPTRAIVPCAVAAEHPLTTDQCRAIAEAGGAWLLIRTGSIVFDGVPPLAADVAARIVADIRKITDHVDCHVAPIAESSVYLLRVAVPSVQARSASE